MTYSRNEISHVGVQQMKVGLSWPVNFLSLRWSDANLHRSVMLCSVNTTATFKDKSDSGAEVESERWNNSSFANISLHTWKRVVGENKLDHRFHLKLEALFFQWFWKLHCSSTCTARHSYLFFFSQMSFWCGWNFLCQEKPNIIYLNRNNSCEPG